MNSIFEKTLHIDPEYQFLEKYVNIMYKGFWTPMKYEKSIKEKDTPHFFNVLKEVDQETISRCILAISIVEDKVKTFWGLLPIDLPQTIIGDVAGLFSQSEVTHRRSYHSLAENLKLDTNNLEKHKALQGRIKYLSKYLVKDTLLSKEKKILKKLVLFTSLVERCSLFTQFYIIMSYAKRNRGLKAMSALQESTALEEDTHYNFGLDIINKIKNQHPELWDDYLIDLVKDNIEVAYKSELELIDWFFEKGVPKHITKEEVVNFLNYNFNMVSSDLKIPLTFDYDKEVFKEKNEWFTVKVFMTTEPDFFDDNVSSYASDDEQIDLDNFQF